jgi:uncharacterized DUF497 family protein
MVRGADLDPGLAALVNAPLRIDVVHTLRYDARMPDVVYHLNDIEFVWDRKKAESNLRKHSVAFETACETFFDPFVCFIGTEVIEGERRETILGMALDWRILRVVYAFQKTKIRIVSARLITKQERRAYENQ